MLSAWAAKQIERSEHPNHEHEYVCPDCGTHFKVSGPREGECPECGRGYVCYGGSEGVGLLKWKGEK